MRVYQKWLQFAGIERIFWDQIEHMYCETMVPQSIINGSSEAPEMKCCRSLLDVFKADLIKYFIWLIKNHIADPSAKNLTYFDVKVTMTSNFVSGFRSGRQVSLPERFWWWCQEQLKYIAALTHRIGLGGVFWTSSRLWFILQMERGPRHFESYVVLATSAETWRGAIGSGSAID